MIDSFFELVKAVPWFFWLLALAVILVVRLLYRNLVTMYSMGPSPLFSLIPLLLDRLFGNDSEKEFGQMPTSNFDAPDEDATMPKPPSEE